jgi:hypothetical protein
MMGRLSFGVLGAATALVATSAQSGEWTHQIAFQECKQLEETSGYDWYHSDDIIGVRPESTDYTKISTTRLKCVIHFPGFAALAMVLAFDDSTWVALPDNGGAGGDRRIIVKDNFGDEMIPLDEWPRWKEQAQDHLAIARVGPASWIYLFDRPTTQISVTLRATDSWDDRQITWTIERLYLRVLEADQTAVRPSIFYSPTGCRLLH